MFDRLSIRTKLIAMVAAPLVVIVALAGVGFGERRAEASTTTDDVHRLEAIEANLDLQHELQVEALYSVGFVASGGTLHAEDLGSQQERTDEAAGAYETSLDALGDDLAVPAGRSSVRQIRFLDTSLRAQVEAQSLAWPYVDQLYAQLMAALLPVNDRLATAISDAEVAAGARSVVSLGEYSATTARVGTVLEGAAATGGFSNEDGVDTRREFLDAVAQGDEELAIVGAQAAPSVRVSLRNQMVGGDVTYFSEQVDAARGLEAGEDLTIDAARWSAGTEATLDQLRDITATEADSVLAGANDRVASSRSAARLFLAAALLAIVLAVGLALYVAASIVRPLLSLTRAADQVATEQLPRMVEALRNPDEDSVEHLRPEVESLEVGGGKELARLSASVSSIQEVAVDVATEQAALLRKGIGDMFINLARRNQALLDRQLEFIDELEAEEEDPDGLEALFTLDHMATRMRRNAESLLVLAGAEPSRRRGRPVPLTKVTLAAVGEIEHFARVDLLEVDECEVTSKAAADIAHLLSELMENATQFSPPETRVEVVGHRLRSGSYTLSITDQGIGMSPTQLTEANDMLAHPPLLGLTLARTLGFIVVGRLAARHGIAVRLVASPAGGVTAIVSLPSSVLVADGGADTVDLRGDAPAAPGLGPFSPPAPAVPVAPGPVADGPPNPSSILPPFEFASEPQPEDDPAPSTLEEAVPSGRSFEEGLSHVREPAPEVPAEVTPLFGPPAAPRPAAGDAGPVGAPEPLPDDLLSPRGRAGDGGAPDGGGLPRRQPQPTPASSHHLFGPGPEATPGAPAEGGAHLFRAPAERPPAAPDGADDHPAPPPAEASPIAEAPAPAPELTSAGLVKRVPRSAGATRAVPGSDGGARAPATTSGRSPEEVRSMLSRFQSGRQAGQVPTPADPATGTPGAPPSDTEEH